jgi:hypothetical protein
MARNVEKLQKAGVVVEAPPPEYSRVFEELTDFEMEVILALKRRLDSAVHQLEHDPESFYGFVAF